jgi:hypothetical protein
MTFAPAIRRLTYTTHITSSLAWVGAVVVFIGLAVIGLTSADETTARGAADSRANLADVRNPSPLAC